MILTTTKWAHKIEFDENRITTLVIENPRALREYILGLQESIETGEGCFVLSDGIKSLPIEKELFIIMDLLNPDFSGKKISLALNQSVKRIASRVDFDEPVREIACKIQNLAFLLEQDLPDSVSHKEEIGVAELIKILEFKCVNQSDSLVETIVDYMDLLAGLCGITAFILVNANVYLDISEINSIAHDCVMKKRSLLFIEPFAPQKSLAYETRIVIDKDLCEIV